MFKRSHYKLCMKGDKYFWATNTGVAAATKKWRDLINIHDLDCTTKIVVSDQQASKTVRD